MKIESELAGKTEIRLAEEPRRRTRRRRRTTATTNPVFLAATAEMQSLWSRCCTSCHATGNMLSNDGRSNWRPRNETMSCYLSPLGKCETV